MLTLKKKKSVGKQLAELHLPPMKEQLPYETLEVLVNHENIWANLQGHNLTGSSFNLEDTDRWHPFIDHGEDGWVPPAPPRPFYSVGRIGPQLPPQRLSALKAQLFRAIKIAYADWRTTRSLRTRWASSLEPTSPSTSPESAWYRSVSAPYRSVNGLSTIKIAIFIAVMDCDPAPHHDITK